MSELLGFKAHVNITEAKARIAEMKKMLADLKVDMPKGADAFNVKPLTEYQKELVRIKQEALDAQKANRDASLATQKALADERLELVQINKQMAANKLAAQEMAAAKKSTVISDSTAEIEAYKKSKQGVEGLTSAITDQDKAQAQAANSATSVGRAVTETDAAQKKSNLTKKEAAKLIAEEKYIQQQSTAALKNHAREMLNAKGSTEQRRAALIRLQTTLDRLSATERATPAGQRLTAIVARLNDQVLTLEKSTGRAGRNVGNYLNTAWSGLKTLANILPGVGLAGLLAFALDPLLKYIKTLDIFKAKVSQLSENQKLLNEVYRDADKDAGKQISTLKILYNTATDITVSTESRIKAAKELKKEYPESFKNSKIQAILNGEEKKTFDELTVSILENARARAAADKLAEIESKRLDIEFQRQKIRNANANEKIKARPKELTDESGVVVVDMSIEDVRRASDYRAKQALAEQDSQDKILKNQSDFLTKYIGNEKLANTVIKEEVEKKANQFNAEYNARLSLQKKIDDLHRGATKTQLESNEAEIQNIKDKYAAIRAEVEEYYKKYKKLRVDAGKLAGDEKTEIDNAIYRQDTERLKVELDKQKQLYSDYEAYKSALGKEAADERYSKELNVYGTYLDQLTAREDTFLAKGIDSLTANEKARLKVVQDAKKAELDAEQKKQDEVVKQWTTYAQKRQVAEEKLATDLAVLVNNPEARAIRQKAFDEEMAGLNKAQMTKLESYKAMFVGIENLSVKSAERMLRSNKQKFDKEVESGKIKSQEEIEAINQLFDALYTKIRKGNGQELIELARQLDNIVSIIGDMDSGFGKVLSTLSNVVGQVGNIKNDLAKINAKDASGFDKLTAGLGIFGAGMAVVKGITGIFEAAEKRREERAAAAFEIQSKQNDALNKSLERQIQLMDDVYGTDRIKKYAEAQAMATESERRFQDQLKGRYALTNDSEINKLIEKANAGVKITDTAARRAFEDMVKKGIIKSVDISGLNLEQLRQLAEGSSIDEGTKSILNNIIASKQAIIDLANQLKAEAVGSSLDQIAESFISTLTDGTQDFGKSFEEVIQKSILNGFKGELIRKQLQGFYDKFAELAKDGGLMGDDSAAKIAELRALYSQASEQAKAELAALEKATGIKLTGDGPATPDPVVVPVEIDANLLSLQDEIFALFQAGTITVEDFGRSFEEIIKRSILEGFKTQVFTDGLKTFYDKLKEFQSQGPLTKDQIAILKDEYLAFVNDANVKLKALEEATGMVFGQVAEQIEELPPVVVEVDDSELKSLQASIFALFENGTIAAEDFGAEFERIIRESILGGFQQQVLAEGLKGFYDQLKAAQESGGMLTTDEIAALKESYQTFIGSALDQLKTLEQLTGVSFAKVVEQELEETVEVVADKVDSEFEALQDSILAIFAGGKDAAADFTTNFEELMRKALLNSFKQQYLAGALKGFYDQLAGYTANGQAMSEAQIAALKVQYDAIIANGKERLKEFEQISGVRFEGGSSSSSLARNVTQISSQQAGAIEGIMIGQYQLQKQMVSVASLQTGLLTAGNKTMGELFNVAKSNLAYQERIAKNTADTVNRLDLIVSAMQTGSSSLRGAGLG